MLGDVLRCRKEQVLRISGLSERSLIDPPSRIRWPHHQLGKQSTRWHSLERGFGFDSPARDGHPLEIVLPRLKQLIRL